LFRFVKRSLIFLLTTPPCFIIKFIMTIPKELSLVWSKIENKKRFYLGIFAALASSAVTVIIPYIYGRLVDVALKPNSEIKIILGIILLWLILSVLNEGLIRYSVRRAYEISTDIYNNLYIDIFQHLISLPLKFHKEKKMGKVMSRIVRGLEEVFDLVERTVFSFLPTVISLIMALLILPFVEWRLSLILIITCIFYALITFSYTNEIMRKQKRMWRGWDKAEGETWDSVLNVEAVKATSNEDFEKEKSIRNFSLIRKISREWRGIWVRMSFWQGVVLALSFVSVFGAGIFMLRSGNLTPGKFIMFLGYAGLLATPLSQLADQYRGAKTGLLSLKRALTYYNIEPEKDFSGAKEIKEIKGEVVFEGVLFGYKTGKHTLKNISFSVNSGEKVALVGESGVGKTTLMNLIGRYYLPQKGRILIDGIDIKKIKLHSLRKNMAVVPQEVLLFNDTIKNNIKYSRPDATEKEIIEAAKAANAHQFIESFPKKYEQLVGERGIKLSTGQKQRVAIARAVLRKPKILILDEATSALDSASEKLVQEALARLIKGRTTFIIAHRLSTIQHADKIIVLEKGKVAEIGTHHQLMQNPEGIYRNFWELQTAIHKIK